MTRAPKQILFAAAMIVVVGFSFYSLPNTINPSAQQGEKQALDLERYGDEPLELVDLEVSGVSIKNAVKVKFRNGNNGRDKADFTDRADWFKRIRIRMRNKSDKIIVGLQAYLYFKPLGSPLLFSASLKGSKQLEHTVLNPGDEVQMTPDNGSLDRAINRIKDHGGDPNLAEVTFSVEIVGFSDGLQWHKGHTLRTDPGNPNRRIPIQAQKPLALRLLDRPGWLTPIGFNLDQTSSEGLWGKSVSATLTRQPPQANAQCVLDNGSYEASHCINDEMSAWCYAITDLGAGQGTSSSVEVIGDFFRLRDAADRSAASSPLRSGLFACIGLCAELNRKLTAT